MVKGTRDIYWLSAQSSNYLDEKLEVLRRFQIEVILVENFQSLARSFTQKRLGTIIISDQFTDQKWREFLQTITLHPEYSGVRFLLSLSKPDQGLCELASSLGFRDILPIDLKPDTWIRRYLFSASGQASYLPEPLPQISSRHIAAVHVPARISWMTENEFWIETKLVPPVGTQLHLSGGPASYLGLKKLSFRVLEHHQTHLHFRYSDALLCKWDLPKEDNQKRRLLIDFLQQQKQSDPLRIYSIIRSKDFRKELLLQLDPSKFHLSIALNKTNMIHEPRYIGPDGIIVEDKMCTGIHRENFVRMMEMLPTEIPVFIIGPEAEQLSFSGVPNSANIIKTDSMPKDIGLYLSERLGTPKLVREGVTFIPKYHRLSYARIHLPARIIQLHPEAARISLPFALGRFSLCTLESPFLQNILERNIQLKVVQGHFRDNATDKTFPFELEAILTDLLEKDRDHLANELIHYFQKKLSELGYAKEGALLTPPPPEPQAEDSKSIPEPEEKPVNLESPVPEITAVETSPKEEPITRIEGPSSGLKLSHIFASFYRAIPFELKVLIITVSLFALMYLAIAKFRQEPNEETTPFMKSIRLYKEMNEVKDKKEINQQVKTPKK